MIVVQVMVRCCEAVNSSSSLRGHLIRILLRVEYNSVSRDAIPPLTAGGILNQVDPFVSGWNLLMLMTVPLCDLRTLRISEGAENLQFIVVAVKDDGLGMILQDFEHSNRSGVIRIDNSPKCHTQFRCRFDWTVLPRIPTFPHDVFVFGNIIRNGDVLVMRNGLPLEVHVYEDAVA